MDPDKRTAWLCQLDKECPYQVVLPRRQLADDSEILNFLLRYAGKFDMYVEDDYAAFVRYCFEDPLDAEIFRALCEVQILCISLACWLNFLILPGSACPAFRTRATALISITVT